MKSHHHITQMSNINLESEDKKLKQKIRDFLATNPSEIEIEKFYLVEVLPYDKRSMTEILDEGSEIDG